MFLGYVSADSMRNRKPTQGSTDLFDNVGCTLGNPLMLIID
ncbi:hypothetical protein NHE_0771 [Neorickettsia helminthoeca str. Oregon]|uniref:Uncharacterized protein n=1 Tax=Neorickettsia helminthoeca str. Oregon TaxID=1286528 RepID=X5HKU8_9RICK|nr:hypothetical protein NHE_0771 [Neorickettsia helminthoeca str. Oregon]